MRFLSALLFSLLAFNLYASDLTRADVERWIKTHGELQSWLDQHQEQLPDEDFANTNLSMEELMAKGIQQLRTAGLYNEFNRRVQRAGFSNVEHWAKLGQQISLTYMAIGLEENPQALGMFEAQLRELRSARDIPAEEKAMYEAMLNESINMMRQAQRMSSASKAAVRPYQRQLEELFDQEDSY
ncbi:hypothetical protein [Marinospirillum alkaliphilum]|uniref:Uncharacterized protein n=1 Tax=Marinospirillum alkaliphilum DSM 21637 TaxID=1122209 RepID=A0A1K1X5X0_9GAMM|nr:hypothetical protein [Marinospirillum alkaliphilum]SFX44723.1 hypothetical protein SAMN02745752_01719 [Marinospirillum alkaliphilum DSM 21637]